jgi:hypothetical protein
VSYLAEKGVQVGRFSPNSTVMLGWAGGGFCEVLIQVEDRLSSIEELFDSGSCSMVVGVLGADDLRPRLCHFLVRPERNAEEEGVKVRGASSCVFKLPKGSCAWKLSLEALNERIEVPFVLRCIGVSFWVGESEE